MNRLTSGPNPVQLAAFLGAGLGSTLDRFHDAQRTLSYEPTRTFSQVREGAAFARGRGAADMFFWAPRSCALQTREVALSRQYAALWVDPCLLPPQIPALDDALAAASSRLPSGGVVSAPQNPPCPLRPLHDAPSDMWTSVRGPLLIR